MDPDRLGQTLDDLLRESQARSAEQGERLAQHLIRSVLPVFVVDAGGRPDRRGSSVLVQIDGYPFAFTARLVLNEGDFRLHAAAAPRGRLAPLPYRHAFGTSTADLDVAVLPLRRSHLGAFAASIFIAPEGIDEDHDVQQSLNSKEVPADVVPPVFQELMVRLEELHRGVPLRDVTLVPPLLRSFERVISVQDDERAFQFHQRSETPANEVEPPRIYTAPIQGGNGLLLR